MSARGTISGLALALTLAACAKPADQAAMMPAAVDSAAVRSAVAELWTRWVAADTAGNVEVLASMITDSARIDVKGMPPFLGREAWKATAVQAMKMMDVTAMAITPDMTIPISNELAYQNGNYVESYREGKKASTDHGRYAAAVRKDPDGQWRVAYIMVFADSTVTAKK